MTGTANSLAVRDRYAPAQQAPAALAIQAGQTTWDEYQNAALNQLGLREAGNGDRAVFLHVCQRTGLDPFARQIYMIGRPEEIDGKWGKKWTIQTGIEGWRVIRARAEAREKVRGILGRAVWYDAEGNESKAWFRPEPPTACEITYTVRSADGTETPYTSVLMFREYVQTKKDGKPTQMWTVKGAHMLEKCTEADVYRKAFPQDFSGVQLDDAMPPPDPDAPAVQPERQRVTAADARARAPQHVTTTVVTADASPAGQETTPAPVPPALTHTGEPPAGEAPATAAQVKAIWACLRQDYGYTAKEEDTARVAVAMIADKPLNSLNDLTAAKASYVLDKLHEWVKEAKETGERPRDILAADIASRDADPREDGEPGE